MDLGVSVEKADEAADRSAVELLGYVTDQPRGKDEGLVVAEVLNGVAFSLFSSLLIFVYKERRTRIVWVWMSPMPSFS